MPALPHVPELEPRCGSWVVLDRRTGQAVCEIFDRRTAERINIERYELKTAAAYLGELNRQIKSNSQSGS